MKKSINRRFRELFTEENKKRKTHCQMFVCELMNNLFIKYKNKSTEEFTQYLNRDQCGVENRKIGV